MTVLEGVAASEAVQNFLKRWNKSEGGEHRTYQMFLTELCQLLDVPLPGTVGNDYCFERPVATTEWDGSPSRGRMDLYKRDCFVLEAKQGSFKHAPDQPVFPGLERLPPRKGGGKGHGVRGSRQWDDSMERARNQAKRYALGIARNEPGEPVPPFLIVADIGYSFELLADFSRTGLRYRHFPDTRSFRFQLEDLASPAIRQLLKTVWTNPLSLGREAGAATTSSGSGRSSRRTELPAARSCWLRRVYQSPGSEW